MIELTPEVAFKAADIITMKASAQVVERMESSEAPDAKDVIKETAELAEFLGAKTGRIVGVAVAAMQAGYIESYETYMKEHGLDDEGRKHKEAAKTLADCENCQCNYCARLETCKQHREGAEKIRRDGSGIPWPCVGCKQAERFKPCGNGEPDCEDWEEMDGTNYT